MKSLYKPISEIGTGRWTLQVATRARVYEGPDHLLIVRSTGYSEDYKRVFYRDIRYVVIQKSNGQFVEGIISGILFLGFFLLCLTPLPTWVPVLLCLPFLIWFILNWVKGAKGKCYINTAVQTLEIPAPRRIDKFTTFIAFLNSRIAPGQPEIKPVAT